MNTNKRARRILSLCVSLPLLCAGHFTRASVAASSLASRASAHLGSHVAVFGFVRLADGLPAAGRIVRVADLRRSHEMAGALPLARANDAGAFALNSRLPVPGKYVFHVAGASADVRLTAGGRPYTLLFLRMGPHTVAVHPPFLFSASHQTVIFGIVTLPDGRTPVSLSKPVLAKIAGRSQGPMKAGGAASVGESGAFVLPSGLPSGSYRVVVTDKSDSIVARERFVVPQPQPPYMVLIVKAAPGALAGHVVDSTGRPVMNGTVVLINEPRDLLYSAITGKGGRYAIKHVLSGQYVVVATSNPANRADFEGMEGVVVIKNGQLAKDFTVWAEHALSAKWPRPLPSLKAARATISGRVLDAAGRPVVAALVMLDGVPQPQGPRYSTITSRSGHYVIKHVLPGQYIVKSSSDPAELPRPESIMEVVVIKDGRQEKDFKLRRPTQHIPW